MFSVIQPDTNLHCISLSTPLKYILHFSKLLEELGAGAINKTQEQLNARLHDLLMSGYKYVLIFPAVLHWLHFPSFTEFLSDYLQWKASYFIFVIHKTHTRQLIVTEHALIIIIV